MMMDKNDIRQISTPLRGNDGIPLRGSSPMEQLESLSIRKVSIDKLLKTDMTYEQMSKLTGMSVYEIRRYTGSIQ